MKQVQKAMEIELNKILKSLKKLDDMEAYKGVYIDSQFFYNIENVINDSLNAIKDDQII